MYLQIFQTLIRKNQCPISRMSTQFRSLLLTLLLLTLPPILEEHEKHLFLSPPHSWNPNPMEEEPISPIFLVYIILNFRWLFKNHKHFRKRRRNKAYMGSRNYPNNRKSPKDTFVFVYQHEFAPWMEQNLQL